MTAKTAPLNTYFEDMERANWPESLWYAVKDYFASHGIDMICYQHIPPAGAADEGKRRIYAEGYPEGLIAKYIREKKYRVDPVSNYALNAAKPFRWSEIRELTSLSKAQVEFLEEARANGLTDGLAVQVFGPAGRNGYFGLGFGPRTAEIGDEQVREMQWVCQSAHMKYCDMVKASLPSAPHLTERELEILAWVSRGKSNSVIADIMGISTHTVDAYLRRAFLKLGTTDRITAAIRALGAGLISTAA